MTSFAAPNMTAVGTIGSSGAWETAVPGLSFAAGAPFTLEAWVRFTGAGPQNAQILTKPGEFAFWVAGGVLGAGWVGGAAAVGQTVMQPEVWYFLAVTYDGQTLTLYVDGAAEATLSTTGPGSAPTPSPLVIGGQAGSNAPCDLWDLTIYNTCRTADQEDQAPWVDLATSPGLLAHFDFSTAPAQETVNKLPMTATGVAQSETVAPGVLFDGHSSGLMFAEGAAPTITGAFSASAWVCFNTLDSTQSVLSYASNGGAGFVNVGLSIASGTPSLFASAGGMGAAAPTSIQVGEWHNIALTYDGQTFTLYLDGVSITSFQSPGFAPQPGVWTFGFDVSPMNGNKENWLAGGLQWLSGWNLCLAPADVQFQQYGSVSDHAGVLFDVALDVLPLTDLANGIPVELGGAAQVYEQRVAVTAWTPPPAQLNPPGSADEAPVALGTAWTTPRVARPAALAPLDADGLIAAGRSQIADVLGGFGAEVIALHQARFEAKARKTFRDIETNPELLTPGRWVRQGDKDAYVYRDPRRGDLTLAVVEAGSLTACQQWWLSFVFTLLLGVLNLYWVKVKEKTLTDWVQRRVLGDRELMDNLARIFSASPRITGATVIALLGGIYSAGLVKNFLWFVAYQIGYFGLGKLFLKLAALVAPVASPFVTAEFIANALLLATQLSTQIFGAPNVPSYSQACGSGEGACSVESASC